MAQIQTSVYGLITFVNKHGKVVLKISTTINGDHYHLFCERLKEQFEKFWPTTPRVIQQMAIENHFGSPDSLVIMSRHEVLASGFAGTSAEFEENNPRYRKMFSFPEFHPEWNNLNPECVVVMTI